jgi:hypothetical protein
VWRHSADWWGVTDDSLARFAAGKVLERRAGR